MLGAGFIQDRLAPSRPPGVPSGGGACERSEVLTSAAPWQPSWSPQEGNRSFLLGQLPLASPGVPYFSFLLRGFGGGFLSRKKRAPKLTEGWINAANAVSYGGTSWRCCTRPLRRNLRERKSPSNSLIEAGRLGFLCVLTLGFWNGPGQSVITPAGTGEYTLWPGLLQSLASWPCCVLTGR